MRLSITSLKGDSCTAQSRSLALINEPYILPLGIHNMDDRTSSSVTIIPRGIGLVCRSRRHLLLFYMSSFSFLNAMFFSTLSFHLSCCLPLLFFPDFLLFSDSALSLFSGRGPQSIIVSTKLEHHVGKELAYISKLQQHETNPDYHGYRSDVVTTPLPTIVCCCSKYCGNIQRVVAVSEISFQSALGQTIPELLLYQIGGNVETREKG